MARPKKEYKIQRNGNSVQLIEGSDYCGSLPIAMLCELARNKKEVMRLYTQGALTHRPDLKRTHSFDMVITQDT